MTMAKEIKTEDNGKRVVEEAADRFAGLLVEILITQAEREAEDEVRKLKNETKSN